MQVLLVGNTTQAALSEFGLPGHRGMRKLYPISFFILAALFLASRVWAVDYLPSRYCLDQGSLSAGCAKALAAVAGSNQATLRFIHSSGYSTTTYTFATPFAVPGNIKIEVDKGAILTGPITGLTSATPAMFGAKGDGTTDDAAAIQKAIDSGASVVDGENKLYRVSAKISLVSNQLVKNFRLFDPHYRTTGKHNFLQAVGTAQNNLTNVSLDTIEILGNNSTYAVMDDSWTYNSYGSIDGIGIFFRYVNGGKIANVTCKYLESGAVVTFSAGITVDNFQSTQAEALTHTGFTFGASRDSYARNIRIYNGGDGALYIYNGANCHITDSFVINTTPLKYHMAGAGTETSVGCSFRNVTVKGAWAGFSLVEGAMNASIIESVADGCHVGFLLGPYGYGYAGSEISIAHSRVVHMTDHGQNYPVSGILVYNPGPSYHTSHNVNIIDNYIGQSDTGVGIYVDVPAGYELQRLKIRGNTIEASSLRSFDWELQKYSSWSTGKPVLYLRRVAGADISGNTFTDKSTPANAAIELAECKDIMFHNNNVHAVGSTILVGSDAQSERISAMANKIIASTGSGYRPFNLLGRDHLVKDNPGCAGASCSAY